MWGTTASNLARKNGNGIDYESSNCFYLFNLHTFALWILLLTYLTDLVIAGGQSSLADYCTYFVVFSDGSSTHTNIARELGRMLGEVRTRK